MAESVTIRMPRWLVYVVGAVVLVAAGIGTGLAVGGDGSSPRVATGKRPDPTTTSTSVTSTSTTSTTAPAAAVGSGGGGNAGNGGNRGGGNPGAVAPPAPPAPVAPAATADVSKSADCPTVVTWSGTGGVSYTLQVYNAVPGGAALFNGPVAAAGQMSFDCVGNPPIQVPRVGLVRFNTNTASGTVSDNA
jgi:hypothetical protein